MLRAGDVDLMGQAGAILWDVCAQDKCELPQNFACQHYVSGHSVCGIACVDSTASGLQVLNLVSTGSRCEVLQCPHCLALQGGLPQGL